MIRLHRKKTVGTAMKSEHFIATRLAGLADWVLDYHCRATEAGSDILLRRATAHPHIFLHFVLEGHPLLRCVSSQRATIPPLVALFGPLENRSYDIETRGRVRTFAIRLQPGAVKPLLGRNAADIVNRHVVFPQAEGLRQELAGLSGDHEMVAAAERWLAPRVLAAPPPNRIMHAAAKLLADAGVHEINRLAQDMAYSPRQFQRAFKAAVGLPPKSFARLCRLGHAIRLHETEPTRSWTEIAFRSGFADQSHLIREFRAILSISPCAFQRYALK